MFMLVAAIAAPALAYDDILLISDCQEPGVAGGDHNDDALVAFLQDLGYSVDTSGMNGAYKEGNAPFSDTAKVNTLKGVGLVLVSRRTNSGAYDNDRKSWNELANPLILNSAYLTRGETSSKRWGWTTGGSSNADGTETEIDWTAPVHPFTPHTVYDWSAAPTPGQSPKGPYLPIVAGGEGVAGDILAEFDGRPWLVDIQAGTDLDALNSTSDKYGVTGDNRVFMGVWGYDDGTAGTNGPGGTPSEWGDYLTLEYKAILSETIRQKIPEPMTLSLLGLGGLALIRRKRKV
jgi:hypothetical protein